MLTLWVVYALGVSICVAVVALAVEHVLAIWTLPRRTIWIAALLFVAVVPAGMALRHAPIAASRARPRATRARTLTGGVARVVPRPTPARLRFFAAAMRANPYVERAWALASLLALGVFVRGLVGLARRRASWREVRLRGSTVLVARDAGPAVVGVLRPEIVVPEWALALDETALSLMLRHEREHLSARDPNALLFATLLLIVFPWNLALWWMVHRLRLSIEIDCDARVLRAIDAPREYGMLLLAVGERRSLALPLSASLAERRSLLERRIHAMTTLRPRHPVVATLPFAALAVAASIAAAQTSPPPAGAMIRASAESGAVATARIQSGTTVTPTEMHAILSLHHPGALQGDPDMSRIAIVLDANDNYVKSVVRAPIAEAVIVASAAARASATVAAREMRASAPASEERASDERAITERAASAGFGVVSRRSGAVDFSSSVTSSARYGNMSITGIGEIRGEEIRAVETVMYGAGEMGTTPIHVLIIKLK